MMSILSLNSGSRLGSRTSPKGPTSRSVSTAMAVAIRGTLLLMLVALKDGGGGGGIRDDGCCFIAAAVCDGGD